jgi:type I restriction enzyme, S subunit
VDVAKDMKSEVIEDSADHITEEAVSASATRMVPAGAVLIVVRSGILRHTIPVAITARPVALNQDMKALIPSAECEPRFLKYVIQGQQHVLLHAWTKTGATVESIEHELLANTLFPVPPLDEQRAFADYLDEKTAAIDALIARRERHIELLEEKRRSVIDDLVLAKGAAGVQLATSDVPAIGRIPANWRVVRLKFLGDVRTGITKGRALNDTDLVEVSYLRVANVQDGFVDLKDVATIPATRQEMQRFALRRGDLLMNEGGDNDKLGRGTVWEGQIEPCLHQNHVFAFRPYPGVNPRWIDLVTQTSYMRHFFLGRAKQSTNLASISATNLKEAPIVMPPPDEQTAIIGEIRAQHDRLDRLTRAITAQIARLREYRQTLISAAVTGQLPVREEVPA